MKSIKINNLLNIKSRKNKNKNKNKNKIKIKKINQFIIIFI